MPTFDFARPFQFIFDDPAWIKKVLMGTVCMVLSFFLIGIFPLLGYQIRIARQVADGDDTTLPDWVFGEDFVTGLKVFVIGIAYALPGLVVYIFGIVIGAVLGGGGRHGGGDNPLPGLIIMGSMCLSIPLSLVGGLLALGGVLRFIDTTEMGAAFRVGEVFAVLKNNIVPILLALVVAFVAGFVGELAGAIMCGVGLLATIPMAQYIAGHAYGQVIRIDRARSGTSPSPAVPSTAGAY